MNTQKRKFPLIFVIAMSLIAAVLYGIAYFKFGSSDAVYEFMASGHTLISLAFSITVAVILSPLTHRVSNWAELRMEDIQAPTATDSAIH